MYKHDDAVYSDDGWVCYGGLTPMGIAMMLKSLETKEGLEQDARDAERKLAQAQALDEAQPRLEVFRELLRQLGVVPSDQGRLYQIAYDATLTISYQLVRIPEESEYCPLFRRMETRPARTLTAVLADDDSLHIQVTGRPRSSVGPGRMETWDAGPVSTTEDLARIIRARGDTHWRPPAPASEPEPVPEPTAAEIARDLLDDLATHQINREGSRGIALATAYATVALAEVQQDQA